MAAEPPARGPPRPEARLRIAIDGSAWAWSRGLGRFTRDLTRALGRVAPERDLTLVLDSASAAREDLPDLPRLVVPTRRAAGEAPGAEARRDPVDLWRTSRALSGFDTVIFPTHVAFVPVRPRCRVGLVVLDAIRDAFPEAAGASPAAARRWRAKRWLACRQATVIATATRASAEAIRAHLPVGGRDVVVLGAGFDPVFSPAPSAEDAALVAPWAPPGRRVVLYVGGVGAHKRVPELIRAFGALAAAPGHEDAVLLLVGAEEGADSERAAVGSALAALGPLADRVARPGFVPDRVLAALYRRASCLVLPSRAEGLGLPALEAMASGTPVVAARIPALEEVCAEAAEYVDHPGELPAAIARVLMDGELARSLALRGPVRAAAFGWDEAARRLLAALGA